ncbi:uncharacterized protein FOMMEDRAFT_27420 [Fomitiporia mediterranea MF3/22]|uniref:uncharacterized protein n=1 Tax=Fomitiporia mediterranea (strain MF3/22) TaxID=694068 RepID=UPI0004407DA4|nr:uncharacterized protein FOMMEDRAFT_27420 [Fomitiporia mediterranea MF3/22]EJD05252.1 hypothetical protein FOMMEDRAFT_27420 [Fomitiporia mediterranea MF3/22]
MTFGLLSECSFIQTTGMPYPWAVKKSAKLVATEEAEAVRKASQNLKQPRGRPYKDEPDILAVAKQTPLQNPAKSGQGRTMDIPAPMCQHTACSKAKKKKPCCSSNDRKNDASSNSELNNKDGPADVSVFDITQTLKSNEDNGLYLLLFERAKAYGLLTSTLKVQDNTIEITVKVLDGVGIHNILINSTITLSDLLYKCKKVGSKVESHYLDSQKALDDLFTFVNKFYKGNKSKKKVEDPEIIICNLENTASVKHSNS